MFTSINTPQDPFKLTTDYFAGYPKTPDEMRMATEKAREAITEEAENVKEVISIYNKAARGEATMNEITLANKKAQNAMVAARFATVMSIPGAVFMLPAMNKIAEEFSVDFIPESVKKAFA